jgi:mannan endo-1,4-beta-mannosidase
VLIIDARGWGQDFSSIVEHGQELAKIDSNTMMSSHMYDSFSSPTTVASAFSQAKQLNIPFMIGEFGCSHGSKGPVACMDIMKEASRAKVGLMAWSYSGNSSDLSDLDLVSASDWRTLTSFGNKILGAYAPFRSESKPACFFTPGTRCP